MKVAITVDVETDWGGRLLPDPKNCQGIEKGLPIIIDLLDLFGMKATFFVSGEVIQGHKERIRELAKMGHEVASHGFVHRLNYSRLERKELLVQVRRSKDVIEDLIGEEVLGFRTPQFKVNPVLFEVLKECGFLYDSSLIKNRSPFMKEGIWEVPVSFLSMIRFPYGLLWINLLGETLFRFFERFKKDDLTVLYMHPFDFLKDKSPKDFGPIVKWWYSHRPEKGPNTLKGIFEYWKREEKKSILVKDVVAFLTDSLPPLLT